MSDQKSVVADWPQEAGLYKVIQIVVDSHPYLRFSQTDFLDSRIEEHGSVLERFLKTNKIPFKLGKRYIPERKGEGYELVGAGRCDVDTETRTARFEGESKGYGILIDRDHLELIRAVQPDWKIEV